MNAAWLALAVLAHNLGRWTLAAAGEGWPKATTATLRTKHGLDARPARPQRQRPPPPSLDELAVARRVREAIVRIAAIPAPT